MAPPDGLPELAWKPLGKGYDHFLEFFLQYCSKFLVEQSNPDLGAGLAAFSSSRAQSIFQTLKPRPRCLIQGITCPSNGFNLYRYLTNAGVIEPAIHAIDIMDVGAIARATGFVLEQVNFSVGDASKLSGWPDHSVQVLVQDHLLNCCPHSGHESILAEAARILDPRGIFILNFSVDPQTDESATLSWQESEARLEASLDGGAYCLKDVVGNGQRLCDAKRLVLGKLITGGFRQIVVTRPYGNFEFYSSAASLENLLARLGMQFAFVSSERVATRGISCTRYHTLVRRIGDAL